MGERVRVECPAARCPQQQPGCAERPAEPARGHAGAAVPEAGPVQVGARSPDRCSGHRAEVDADRSAGGHAHRRPRAFDDDEVGDADREQAPAVGGVRGDQCSVQDLGSGAPSLATRQHPAVAVPCSLDPGRRRFRRPDAPQAGLQRDAELGVDRDGVGVGLGQPGQHEVAGGQLGQRQPPLQSAPRAGQGELERAGAVHRAQLLANGVGGDGDGHMEAATPARRTLDNPSGLRRGRGLRR